MKTRILATMLMTNLSSSLTLAAESQQACQNPPCQMEADRFVMGPPLADKDVKATCQLPTGSLGSPIHYDCHVIASDDLGTYAGRRLRVVTFQVQDKSPAGQSQAPAQEPRVGHALVVAALGDNHWRRIWYYDPERDEGYDSHVPTVIKSPDGPVIQLHVSSGNAVHQFEYLIWRQQAWKPVDWEYWRRDLVLRPGQRTIVPNINWLTMSYASEVYVPGNTSKWGDYAGKVTASLALVGQRVILKKQHFEPALKPTHPDPRPQN